MKYVAQKDRDASLLDPVTCGEDLVQSAARVSELAPIHCAGCSDYHIRTSAQRAVIFKGISHDRPWLIELIREFLARAIDSASTINIVIPGSADTGILATCAHAAAVLGRQTLDRCRFTVIDRCPTPLLLCQEFAARLGLVLCTCEGDLLPLSTKFDADLIVVHSLFRFFEHADQVVLLNRFGGWLRPDGQIIVSNSLRSGSEADKAAELHKRRAADLAIRGMLASGELKTLETAEEVQARLERSMNDGLDRPGDIRSLADASRLFAQTNLRELSLEILNCTIEVAPNDIIPRQRLLAVLALPESRSAV